jgi:pimeloyl-ACP methyl ester carboxylesterase
LQGRSKHAVQNLLAKASGIELSALRCAPAGDSSRGLVVALHGAGYGAGYWAYANPGEPSCLELGAQLGYEVLALERPGYGAARNVEAERCRLDVQVEILLDALDLWTRLSDSTPVFVIGHSVGGALALLMAAAAPDVITAVDVFGVPFRYASTPSGDAVRQLTEAGKFLPSIGDHERKAWLFGPSSTYAPAALAADQQLVRPIPTAEYLDALKLPFRWADVLPRIKVPVQYTVAQHECMQETGPGLLEDVRLLLRDCPLCRLAMQNYTGHNASMAHIATAYHLRAFAFFSEAISSSVRKINDSAAMEHPDQGAPTDVLP